MTDQATDVRPAKTTSTTRLQRWSHALFGYDVFISYRRGDASAYANTLALKLHEQHDLVVFLDDQEFDVGEQLPVLLRAVRHSRMLVVLVTPNVGKSLFVPKEVAAARDGGKRIVPVDFDRTMEQGHHGDELGRLLQDEKWHTESNLLSEGPGESVLDAIARSRRGLKRRVQQRLFFAGIVLALMSLSGYALRLAQQRADALAEQQVRTEHARRLAYGSQLLLANELAEREPGRAKAVLDDEARCPPSLRDVIWNLIAASCTRELWRAPADWKPLHAQGFSGGARLLTLSEDGTARLLRLSDLARFEAAPAAFAGTPLWLTPQSDRLVTLTRDGTVVVWNVAGASELRRVDPQSAHRSSNNPEASAELFRDDAAGIVGAALSSSGRTLATMSKRTVRFWDIASGAELTQRRFDVSNPGDQGPLDTLVAIHASFVNPERFLLLLTSDLEDGYYRAVLMHADADGSSRTVTRDTSARASGLAVARRGGRVAINVRSTDADIGLYAGQSRVLVFDEEGVGGPVHTHTLAQRRVTAIDLDAEGQRLVMAIAPNAVRVVGAATGALLAEWATDSPSSFVAFHPDGNLVLLVSNEGRAALHRVDPGRPTLILRPEDNRVRLPHVRSLQRQGDAIIYGWSALQLDTLGGHIVVDRESGSVIGEPRHYSADFLGQDYGLVELQTDVLPGEVALTGGREFIVRLESGGLDWSSLAEPPGRKPPQPSPGVQDRTARVELSPDGRHLAVVRLADEVPYDDGFEAPPIRKHQGLWVLELIDPETAATNARLWSGSGYPADLVWSHDSNWLALALNGAGVKLWRAPAWAAVADVATDGRARLDFVRDSTLLAAAWSTAAGPSGFAMIDASRGRVTSRAAFGPRRVNAARALSPSRVAIGFDDSAVGIVDVENQSVRFASGPAGSTVVGLDISDDGKTLLVTRLRQDGQSFCTFADPEFGHDVLELRIDGEPVAAAAFLAGARGVVLATPNGLFRWWAPQ